jgi:hypothetical protein
MNRSITIRLKARWVRWAAIVGLVALVAVPTIVLASDRFTDVPITNEFHDDINAIANASVTFGCNPPANTEYCPKDFVSREQMAAFMNRLGALTGQPPVVNAATAEDADTLDGFDSSDFAKAGEGGDTGAATSGEAFAFVAGQIINTTTLTLIAGATDNAEVTFEPTADCTLIMSGSVTFDEGAGDPSVRLNLQWFVNGVAQGPLFDAFVVGANDESFTAQAFSAASAGTTHTVQLRASVVSGAAEVEEVGGHVLCVPFNGAGDPIVAGDLSSFTLDPAGVSD